MSLDFGALQGDAAFSFVQTGSLRGVLRNTGLALVGIAAVLAIWWLGGWLVASNPATANFSGFAPAPTLARLWRMLLSGEAIQMAIPSLGRIAVGLAWAIAFGVPCGILIGRFQAARAASAVPIQFLRMISPLAWMPIAVMAFKTWNGAIIFLIAVAAIWPILFSTAHGFRRIDPAWFKVARNLGARPGQMLLAKHPTTQGAVNIIFDTVGKQWQNDEKAFEDSLAPLQKESGLPDAVSHGVIRLRQFDGLVFEAVGDVYDCDDYAANADLKTAQEILAHAQMAAKGKPDPKWNPENLLTNPIDSAACQ